MPVPIPSWAVRLGLHAFDLDALGHDTGGLGWFNVKSYGATGDGSTDDTGAFQNAIDAAAAAGGGTVWLPAGEYKIAGALQDTGAFNAQLLLPNVSTSDPQVVIRFKGAAQPPFAYHGTTPSSGYSIIRSTLSGASGTAAVVSGGNGSYPGTQNNVSVIVEDLLCIGPDDPTFTFWNLRATQGGGMVNVQISTDGAYAGSPVQPTHTNSYGVALPQVRNSNYTRIKGLASGQFYTGILMGEMVVAEGLVLGLAIVGIEFPAVEHGSLILEVQATGCKYVFKATGDHRCDIILYDQEHNTGPAWSHVTYDLDDASNHLYGFCRWTGTPTPSFIRNGGSNFGDQQIGATWGSSGFTAGGDLTGTSTSQTVAKINGSPLGTISSPATGDRLRWNGSAWVNSGLIWRPVTTYDPTSGLWVPLVDGAGNAIMAEA